MLCLCDSHERPTSCIICLAASGAECSYSLPICSTHACCPALPACLLQASELEAEAQRAGQELQQLQAEEQRARQEVAAADQAERVQRLALQQVKRRQYEAQSALTQLTQQPPPELTAATQAGGDEALQADIWQVGLPWGGHLAGTA